VKVLHFINIYSIRKYLYKGKGGKMRLEKNSLIVVISLLFVISVFAGYQNAHATFYNLQQPLVETDWVVNNLDNPKVKIIFVDNWPSEKEAYEKGHIPGSVMMGVGALMGTLGDGSAPPDKKQFEAMMSRLGVNNGDLVIVYGAKGDSVFTLGAFWLMEYFGHKNLAFLNGGLAKWTKEGRPTKSGMEMAKAGTYKAASPDESIRADAPIVLTSLKNPNAVLVDARGTGEYKGDVNNEKNKRVGHIPGAHDLGYEVTNFNEDGTVKSAADLNAVYGAKGVSKDKEVIAYCQGGIKAANAYFTLKHILGYPNVKVYVGSWGEWGNRVDFDMYPAEK
jgi:thiosulfate/3-mercaptopyruvate sulfurtransferase